MTTTEIDAARDALASAEAEVDRLRSKLRAELADQDARGHGECRPEVQRLGWADGVAEARRRHGGSGAIGGLAPMAPDARHTDEKADRGGFNAADGIAEARRRSHLRHAV